MTSADLPTQIGRYRIERLIGTGAMGHVYLGHDLELDRAVAVKTVRTTNLDEDAKTHFMERFRNEARAAARLHHPNIVQVHDVGEDEHVGPFLVFEYVEGSSLRRLIRQQGRLEPEQIVRLTDQIADALSIAHTHGIIHRDIKPDNLLVTSGGDVKLADFGVARVPDADLTKEGQFLGTPCYAAPETLREGNYGAHSDLFSFALVIYEAITGKRAFPGTDAIAVAQHVMNQDPPKPSDAAPEADLDPEIDKVIMKALDKDPVERFHSAHALSAAVRRAYHKSIRPEAMSSRPAAPRSSGSRIVRIALCTVLSLGALVAAIALFDRSPPLAPTEEPTPPTSLDDTVDAGADASLDATMDAQVDAQQEPAGPWTSMTSHEREEAAKDQISIAITALANDDAEKARAALALARNYDPGNADIERLTRKLPAPTPPPALQPDAASP